MAKKIFDAEMYQAERDVFVCYGVRTDIDYVMIVHNAKEYEVFAKYLESIGRTLCDGTSYLDREITNDGFFGGGFYRAIYFNIGKLGNYDSRWGNITSDSTDYIMLDFHDFSWK